ncbi:Glycoside hydrolase [Macleaya cordata]|uniref:Glycoside hydrolase n=1 Tax=Macleaya cordata TaxID=56857 RepID=A0A200Q3K4_MACCD|nr:Glycoside hydrolase [Macleaya cordata]
MMIMSLSIGGALALVQCGRNAGGALCPGHQCCSIWGYCGDTDAYCNFEICQSQCHDHNDEHPTIPPPPPSSTAGGDHDGMNLNSLISRSTFDQLLRLPNYNHNDSRCDEGKNFYTYDAFVEAAKSFSSFAATGDTATRKREIAAFLAQASQQTTDGWVPVSGGGPSAITGYCFVQERNPRSNYCQQSTEWPCAPGESYFGRGAFQITWNYNYGEAGKALQLDLLNNPDRVAQDPIVSFKTALWFWMTPHYGKPSCHDVITGQWQPSPADIAARRLPGFGVTTNIINGAVECGHGYDDLEINKERADFFMVYCAIMRVSPGDNVNCYSQSPFS